MLGRPPKYNKETSVEAVRLYMESCGDKYQECNVYTVDGEVSLDENQKPRTKTEKKVTLPSIAGLAVFMGISRDTVYDWKGKYPYFSDIIEELLTMQERFLVEGGVSGSYNPMISKLILTKHGYADKQEVTGANGKDLIPQERQEEIDQALKEII